MGNDTAIREPSRDQVSGKSVAWALGVTDSESGSRMTLLKKAMMLRGEGVERGNALLKLLDRYIGIPAVATLALFRSRRRYPADVRCIGLLKTVAIGDTVLLSGPLYDLRDAFPNVRVIVFTGGSNYEAARLFVQAGEVVRLKMTNVVGAIRRIRQERLDLLFDFGSWPRVDALLAQASGAFTVGFRSKGQFRHYGYDRSVAHSGDVHELENYRNLLRACGIRAFHEPRIQSLGPASSYAWVSRKFVVFHLWPGGYRSDLKTWPSANWIRLIHEFTRKGYTVVLSGAPSDYEKNERIIRSVSGRPGEEIVNFAGNPLQELVRILSQARLVVSVDTGVMHVAAALDAPLVALHGPSPAKRWGAIGKQAIVIESSLPGCGYLNFGWEYPRVPPPCMEAISYESVKEACARAVSALE